MSSGGFIHPDQLWTKTTEEAEGYYQPGKGRTKNGLEFEVRERTRAEAGGASTKDRVELVLRPDFSKAPDRSLVVLGGWGEPSAMFAGNFLDILTDKLKREGVRNPHIHFLNPGGKGTRDYAERAEASRLGLQASMEDVGHFAEEIHDQLGGETTILGHSMGYMQSWYLATALEKCFGTKQRARLKQITGLMPATDEPLGTLRTRFLLAIGNHVPRSVACYFTGDSLRLGLGDYNSIMHGARTHSDTKNFARSSADSAATFLEWVLNLRRAEHHFVGAKPKVVLVGAAREKLLPEKMASNEADYLRERGFDCDLKELAWFSHAIPFRMTGNQAIELHRADYLI